MAGSGNEDFIIGGNVSGTAIDARLSAPPAMENAEAHHDIAMAAGGLSGRAG